MVRVEQKNEEIQNWILFQTVTNLNAEFECERRKKLKNRENLIHAEEFSLDKIKIFLMKNSLSK